MWKQSSCKGQMNLSTPQCLAVCDVTDQTQPRLIRSCHQTVSDWVGEGDAPSSFSGRNPWRWSLKASLAPQQQLQLHNSIAPAPAMMSLLSGASSAAVGLLTAATNLLTDAFLTPPLQASLAHLEEAELRPLSSGESSFGAAAAAAESGQAR